HGVPEVVATNLSLDKGAIAEAGDADVCRSVVEQRARPVVVAPGGAVIPCVHTPENGAGRRVERIPVRVPSADVKNSVLDGRRRGHAGTGRIGATRAGSRDSEKRLPL